MIPIDSRNGYIWMDGQYLSWPEAKIHVLSHGLHYGSSVFEGVRVYHKKPFKIIEHLSRLLNSANLLNMKIEYSIGELEEVCIELMKLNNFNSGYIRPFIWRGSEDLRVGAYNTIHIAIAMWETVLDKRVTIEHKQSCKLCLSKWRKAPQNVFPAACKGAGAYAMNTVAKHHAEAIGYDDALILDINDFVAEATTSNLFMVKNEKLITPPPNEILNGITRLAVIDLAKQNDIEVVEEFFTYQQLLIADEIFLTGTTIEILPVSRIEHKEFKLGKITKILANKFFALVDNI